MIRNHVIGLGLFGSNVAFDANHVHRFHMSAVVGWSNAALVDTAIRRCNVSGRPGYVPKRFM